MPAILALGRLRQKDLKFEASLDYIANFNRDWAINQDPISKNKPTKLGAHGSCL
jgi:hypothetical protein